MYYLYTAPTDYFPVLTTLTFRAGADGTQPSDAVCVRVPIVDDIVAEQRENLKFRITAIDEDLIWVDEAQAEKLIYIEDNDGQLKDMTH